LVSASVPKAPLPCTRRGAFFSPLPCTRGRGVGGEGVRILKGLPPSIRARGLWNRLSLPTYYRGATPTGAFVLLHVSFPKGGFHDLMHSLLVMLDRVGSLRECYTGSADIPGGER